MFDMTAFLQITWALISLLLAIILLVKPPTPISRHRHLSTDDETDDPTTPASPSPVLIPVDVPAAAPDPLLAAQLASCLQMLGDVVDETRRSEGAVHATMTKIDSLAALPRQIQAAVEASAREIRQARKGEAEADKRARRLEAQVSVDRHIEKRVTRVEAQLRAQEAEDDGTHVRLSKVEAQLAQSVRGCKEVIGMIRAEQRQTSKLLTQSHRELTSSRESTCEEAARELSRTRQDLATARAKLGELEMWKADATREYCRMAEKYAEDTKLARKLFGDHQELRIKFEASREKNKALQQQLEALQQKHYTLLMAARSPSLTVSSSADRLVQSTPTSNNPLQIDMAQESDSPSREKASSGRSVEGNNGDEVFVKKSTAATRHSEICLAGPAATAPKPAADVHEEGELFGPSTCDTLPSSTPDIHDSHRVATSVSESVPSAPGVNSMLLDPTTIFTNPPPIPGTTAPFPISADLTSSEKSYLTTEVRISARADTCETSRQIPAATPRAVPAKTTTVPMPSAEFSPQPLTPPATPVVKKPGFDGGSVVSKKNDVCLDRDDSLTSTPRPFTQSSPDSQPAPHHSILQQHKAGRSQAEEGDGFTPISKISVANTRYSAAYFEAWRDHITTGFNAGQFARAILEIDDNDEADDVQSGWVARIRALELDMEMSDFLRLRGAVSGSQSSYSARDVVAMAFAFFRDVVWVEFRNVYGKTVEEDEFPECWEAFWKGVEAYMAEHPADMRNDEPDSAFE